MEITKFWVDGSITITYALGLLSEWVADIEFHHKGGFLGNCDCMIAPSLEDLAAIKLGMEALKRVKLYKENLIGSLYEPMPGETDEH